MRYVSSIPLVSVSPTTRQVNALSAVHGVKAIHAPEQTVPYVELHRAYQESAVPLVEQQHHPVIPTEDRRKYCRRVKHLAVLEELRSGIDRRHQTLLDGDVVEHIDETV
jgi:hypothetical protein